MLEEPNLGRILEFSPYNNIREGAFDFIQDKVEPVSDLRHAFQRNILDGTLNYFIQDIDRRGKHSEVYQQFYHYFADEDFRRSHGLPLP